jgi:hypothetical protein
VSKILLAGVLLTTLGEVQYGVELGTPSPNLPEALSMRQPPAFRQSDVTRTVKGMQAAGLDVARVEIGRNGAIVVVSRFEAAREGSDNSRDEREHAEAFHAR